MGVEEAESAVLALAARQHGVVSSEQLGWAGLSAGWVKHRVRRGWLRRLYRGVYLIGPLESECSRFMAATLAAGPGALLSHYAAAVLWRLRPPRTGLIDVTVPGRRTRHRPGLTTHRATIHPADVTHRHGIPVTSAARTLLDLAADGELEPALNEALLQRRISTRSLDEQFSRYPRHRGTAALKEATRTDLHFTRSEAERRALDLIRSAGLPEPQVNAGVEGYEVDLLWREQRLIVEVDGYTFHSSRRSFEQDRRRDQRLTAHRWTVIRVTWRQLTREPTRVAATLATALAA